MISIKPIRTDADHAQALARIETLIDAEFGTSQGEELDVLTDLVELYESKKLNPFPLIELGFGLVEVANGKDTNTGRPALIFGRNGSGNIGEPTQPDRVHLPGETIAVISFANVESLDVVMDNLAKVRAALLSAHAADGAAQAEKEPHPLSGFGYVMSESGFGKYRLIIGYETLDKLQAAQEYVVTKCGEKVYPATLARGGSADAEQS